MGHTTRRALAAFLAISLGLPMATGCSLGFEGVLDDLLALLGAPEDGIVAGLIEDPNLWDPNLYDPNYFPQAPPTLLGPWESLSNDDSVEGWDDPESPLAQVIGQDDPFGNLGTSDPNSREFIVFDANNTVVATYNYESDMNTVEVSGPANDPLLGRTLVDLGDGSLGVPDLVIMQGPMAEWLYFNVSIDIVAWPDAEDESWRIEQTFTVHVQVTESESIPPGLQVGDEAVYTLDRSSTLLPSPGPAVLFPDAVWQIAVDEEAVSSSVPSGYVETIGPTGQDSVGWVPGSHETLVQLMDDPNNLPGSMFAEDTRGFALYDSQGRIVAHYDYSDDPEEIVTVGSPADNPMAGLLPVRGDHRWEWTAALTFGDPQIQVSFNARIIMGDGNLSEGRDVVYFLQMTYQVVNQDCESPLGTIPLGATATYSILQEGQMVSSEGPYALFPDAQFVMEQSE